MATADPRVDAYIEAAAPFAQPILRHLRAVVHAACPEVVETIKWGFPHFEHHGIVASMAGFKAHCAFMLWQGKRVLGKDNGEDGGMGHYGKITKLAELPPKKTLVAQVKAAAKLNEAGVARIPSARKPRPVAASPEALADFTAALEKSSKARKSFEAFTDAQRREYTTWIAEAKRDETRKSRIETAVSWIAEGKKRNWKYQRC